ncbi:MAG: hypothetical protein Q8R92_19920 [Deltaproteobacteria bacterium]|nr:hypothetical protein [Deltaproteobacteria bacterium]
MMRSGPSQAWIEGVPEDSRSMVKGRVPYWITPPISRSATKTFVYGPVVTAESREGVHMVKVHNDSALEVWVRTFAHKGIPVRAVVCQEGKAYPLALPHLLRPGDEQMFLVSDEGKTKEIRMRLGTYIDKDDVYIKFGPGPGLVTGFVIIPFGTYSYDPLPQRCVDAARAL